MLDRSVARCRQSATRQARVRLLLGFTLVCTLLAGLLAPAPWSPALFAQEPGPDAPAEPLPDASLVTPAAVLDTPQLVVGEHFASYAFGGNLLYWEDHCYPQIGFAAAGSVDPGAEAAAPSNMQPILPVGAAPDALNSGFLKRTQIGGYMGITVVDTAGATPDCLTYGLMSADVDGVYYYNMVPADPRVVFHAVGNPTVEIRVASVGPGTYPSGERFATDATWVYWGTASGVLRARKDGTSSAPEVVADGFFWVSDVMIVGTTLYIADGQTSNPAEPSVGIWSIPISGTGSCAVTGQPCQESRLSFVGGTHLLSRFVRGVPFSISRNEILWVNNPGEQIRVYSCSLIAAFCSESVAYQIPNDGKDWWIGRPAVYGSTLFFSEGTSTGGNIDRVTRLAVGGSPQELVPTAANTGGYPVAVNGDYVYFVDHAGFENRLYRLSVNATAITRDLFAESLEVTQGIQNLANAIPLSAKKTTFVRAYGRQLAGPQANGVQAVLEGRAASTNALLPGSPLQPLNGTRSLSSSTSWTRENVNSSWLFKLPASWTNSGGVKLTLRVDPKGTYADPNLANNSLLRTVAFGNVPPACAIYVPVRTHNPIPNSGFTNFWDMTGRFQRMWPTPNMLHYTTSWQVQEVQTCWYGPFPYPCGGPLELDQGSSIDNWIPDRDKAIMELWAFNLVNNAPACDDAGAYTHVMGMVHPQAATGGTLGYASTISGESWVKLPPASPNPFPDSWNSMGQAGVMAQELSHNLGRKHVNCGNPDNVDSSYPYSPCTIGPSGQNNYYGFDSKTLTAIGPAAARDYMSYSSPVWSSDYTWRAVRNQLTTSAASLPQVQAAALQSSLGLLVSDAGTVVATGHLNANPANLLGKINSTTIYAQGVPSLDMLGKMAEVLVADYDAHAAAAAAAAPDHGGEPFATNFHIRLIGAGGGVLADKAVTLLPIDDHNPGLNSQVWLASFAAPSAQVVKVQLLADSTVLDEVMPGIRPPVVALLAPTGGTVSGSTLDVQWTASDPDGDALTFIIQYSYNAGVDWQVLDPNHPGNPGGSYQLQVTDLSALHGSAANAARVRIIANDGYNSTVATSPAFTLPNRPPVAAITDPAPGTWNVPGQPILFEGMGTDAEDGALSGSKLTWKVGAATLGTDTSLAVNGMAPGAWNVTLEARDAQNQVGSDTAELRVAPLSIPLVGGALLDGLCDDVNYAGAAQVSLKPYGPGLAGAANVLVMRDTTSLWLCFSGLKRGAASPVATVGLRVDVNDSGDANAQADDYGFFVQEDGGFFTRQGSGGALNAAGPSGLQAMVVPNGATNLWSAEMRIPSGQLGGWDHVVGMMVSHEDASAALDDYTWPWAPAVPGFNAPATWATAVLGLMPAITDVEPNVFTVGGADVILVVEGANILPGARVLWNGVELAPVGTAVAAAAPALSPEEAAALEAERQLTAAGILPESSAGLLAVQATSQISVTVPAALRAAAGSATLVLENTGPIAGAPVVLLVGTPAPVVTSLSPASRLATAPGFTLTVNGSGFMNGAKVVWEGTELATTFVNAGQVTALVPAPLLALGDPEGAGVLVRNPAPTIADSNSRPFVILPPFNRFMFLPLTRR